MITRAIFVLTSTEAGEQFLKILPDLRELGLSEATVLHLVSAQPGPAEPMPELATWVRHFEASLPKVELALKRGDPVKWIYELARVRAVDIVVISGVPNGTDWDFERVSSPLRVLGIPILFLPEEHAEGRLCDQVLVAIRSPDTLERAVSGLQDWFGAERLRAVHVSPTREAEAVRECDGVSLEVVNNEGDVAGTLLSQAAEWGATLLTILAEGEAEGTEESGVPVVKPLIQDSARPILIWPAQGNAHLTR
ncbi:MAG: hypothetical protein JSW46_17535 [Gemmatimonadota bacterium]|nr:MAG: hypothetical protein JSW46_17535 [Gemmatimonadota bacterium]